MQASAARPASVVAFDAAEIARINRSERQAVTIDDFSFKEVAQNVGAELARRVSVYKHSVGAVRGGI